MTPFDANGLAVCQLHLSRDSDWARLEFTLGGAFTEGMLVHRSADFLGNLIGLDETTLGYQPANWISGITSGALYAFRALRLPRRRLLLTRLEGSMHGSGMHALAAATSIGVARLLGREEPTLELDCWQVECKILSPVAVESTSPGEPTSGE